MSGYYCWRIRDNFVLTKHYLIVKSKYVIMLKDPGET